MTECLEDCKERCEVFAHKKSCNCQEYTSPCLTITKIGVALHVKFPLEDGSYSYVDCDINIPTIPTQTGFDGDDSPAVNYFQTVRPVGWLEELRKLENMASEGEWGAQWVPAVEKPVGPSRSQNHFMGEKSWQAKMRMINRDTVLPQQVS